MTIAKKGELVQIVDFGSATTNNFILGKKYVLLRDLNEENGFYVEHDDNNDRNGWSHPFDLGMKFKKC